MLRSNKPLRSANVVLFYFMINSILELSVFYNRNVICTFFLLHKTVYSYITTELLAIYLYTYKGNCRQIGNLYKQIVFRIHGTSVYKEFTRSI